MTAATLIETGISHSTEIDGNTIDQHLDLSPDNIDTGDVVDLVERVSHLEDEMEGLIAKIRELRPF